MTTTQRKVWIIGYRKLTRLRLDEVGERFVLYLSDGSTVKTAPSSWGALKARHEQWHDRTVGITVTHEGVTDIWEWE